MQLESTDTNSIIHLNTTHNFNDNINMKPSEYYIWFIMHYQSITAHSSDETSGISNCTEQVYTEANRLFNQ